MKRKKDKDKEKERKLPSVKCREMLATALKTGYKEDDFEGRAGFTSHLLPIGGSLFLILLEDDHRHFANMRTYFAFRFLEKKQSCGRRLMN